MHFCARRPERRPVSCRSHSPFLALSLTRSTAIWELSLVITQKPNREVEMRGEQNEGGIEAVAKRGYEMEGRVG